MNQEKRKRTHDIEAETTQKQAAGSGGKGPKKSDGGA
jgi:hypothetical protein